MDKIRILYFLEDRAQEGFVKALVERIAEEESIPVSSLVHNVRSARGGYRIIREFRNFLRDTVRVGTAEADLLIVAIDGNCKGYNERVTQLKKYIKATHPFKDKVVYAVPDPHIERWYIIDQRAFKNGVGLDKAPDLPVYKCKKDYYKQVLYQALKTSDVHPLLGGVEYAERIVKNIENLETLGRQNAGFQTFVEDLKRMFKDIIRSQDVK